MDQLIPHGQVGRLGLQPQRFADELVQALLVQHGGDLVDGIDVPDRNDRVQRHVREHRDLGALVVRDGAVGAAQQRMRVDADLAQLLHRVLRGLGLEFAGRGDEGHQRQVHEGRAAAPQAQAHLARGLEEGQRLDVAHRAADLDDGDVGLAIPGRRRAARDEVLDLVGDVRDDLHGLAQVVAPPFLAQHRLVDLAGGEVVHLAHARGDEALVMAQVQVGLGAVFGDEDLAVLERAHRAGIDVDVGIELEEGDFEAARFENSGQRRGGNAFPQGRHHATGNEYVLGHCQWRPVLAERLREIGIIAGVAKARDPDAGNLWRQKDSQPIKGVSTTRACPGRGGRLRVYRSGRFRRRRPGRRSGRRRRGWRRFRSPRATLRLGRCGRTG